MFLRFVKSSAFTHIGYCEETQKLHVRFKSGKVFEYDNVIPEQWEAANEAKSIGSYFCRVIKPGRTFREVKYDGEIKGHEPAAVFIDEAECINDQAFLSTDLVRSGKATLYIRDKETGEEIELRPGAEPIEVTNKISKNWNMSVEVVFSKDSQEEMINFLNDMNNQQQKEHFYGDFTPEGGDDEQ